MTTTYELYTNENGTPKAVEGKAPAIIERVEALETSVESLEGTLDNGVVTSVNGNSGDITPEQTGCLPLSGGTLSGPLKFSNDYISRTTKTNALNISGGNSWRDGGYFEAYGPQINDGMVMLVANNGTTSKHLKVTISGLTYDGNYVITSAGGTMSGSFVSPYIFVRKDTDDSELNIYGSTAENHGGRLTLYGQDSQWTPGGFNLIAANAKTNQWWALSGEANGSLTWGGHHVLQFMNPMTDAFVPTDGSEYVIPWDAIMFVTCDRNASASSVLNLYLNGCNIWNLVSDNFANANISFPVKKGQVFKAVHSENSILTSWAKIVAIGG